MRVLPRSLRGRLVAVFALATAVAIGAALLLLYAVATSQMESALTEGLQNRLAALTVAVRDGDTRTVRRDRFAQVIDPHGRVLLSSARLTVPDPDSSSPVVHRVLTDAELRAALRHPIIIDRSAPLLGPDGRLATRVVRGDVLVVGESGDTLVDARHRLLRVFAIAAPIALAGLALAGWLLAGAVLRPVADLTAEAGSISMRPGERRLPEPSGDDEIARLARTLNEMLGRLAVAFQREREFVDDASHELRTPIAVLRGELELALRNDADGAAVRRSLHNALAEADRLGQLADDLLVLARDRAGVLSPQPEPVPLRQLAGAEGKRLDTLLPVQIRVTGSDVVVLADPDQLARVVSNLVRNAAAAPATVVEIECGVRGDRGLLAVSDDGPGFAPGFVDAAFERFARGDAARTRGATGAGLGLAIVQAMVRANGGDVTVGNGSVLGGALVTVELPLA